MKLFLASMGQTELAFQVFLRSSDVRGWNLRFGAQNFLADSGKLARNCKADLCMKNSSKELLFQSGLNISEKEISKFNLKCHSTSKLKSDNLQYGTMGWWYDRPTVWWSKYNFDRLEIKQWHTLAWWIGLGTFKTVLYRITLKMKFNFFYTFFRSYFGQCNNFIYYSFWNFLTFKNSSLFWTILFRA